jgi:hypothetical protein
MDEKRATNELNELCKRASETADEELLRRAIDAIKYLLEEQERRGKKNPQED